MRTSYKWTLGILPVAGLAIALLVARPGRGDDLTLLHSSIRTTPAGQRIVTGSIRNDAGERLSHVQLDIDMLDSAGALLATAYSSTTNVPPGTAWTFETPVPFENAVRFRITELSCRRDGEASSRPCSSADTVEVRPAASETSGPTPRK